MKSNSSLRLLIVVVSIAFPVVVAMLYFLPKSETVIAEVMLLPKINAIINSFASLMLILGFIAIKNKNVELHKRFMLTALILSVLFSISYLTYHSIAESTVYGGVGLMKTIYYIILISHILLAIVIVPLVLITFSRALTQRFDKHRKIARITLPLWLYVTITGVLVYLMISPYY
ncbi:MAG: DUF420 domain-containing protein [Bacteroidetes bacterium]|nr:MAG: DUF420 domain-containing protein [Bacteroidota bacterium]MBL1143326.1 DUF420 domain-containing protein [Bacteroidota bacterium]NOG56128.1 DUF420 domain-containing protein [Bacteroidota bacterium]